MDDALILALDTASGSISVALTRGGFARGKILAEYSLQPEKSHSRHLLKLVETMLAAAETDWKNLVAIAVSQGPGSFTGLRIGMAAAKGLATALALPLIGVPTLDALVEQLPVPLPGLDLCPVLDARKSQVYAACYACSEEGEFQRKSAWLVMTPEALVARLRKSAGQTLIFGPGAALCAPFAGNGIIVLTRTGLSSRAALTGLCAARLLAAGAGGEKQAPVPLAPLYVRASEAELNLGQAVENRPSSAG